jgi:hypothetical protein
MFIFLVAMMSDVVTFTNGTRVSPTVSRAQPGAVYQSVSTHQSPGITRSLFNMSNEDKARAAAAQLVIDDEPDEWCVKLWWYENCNGSD